MAIPQSFIQDLIARTDVVDVVGKHVQLKKGGANYMGLCPFHGEKSPSFSVSPTKQFYHCFGCGKNGNAIGFLMDHTGASFVEAVHDLAQQTGLTVPEEQTSPEQRAQAAAQRTQQNNLVDVMSQAMKGYQKTLKSDQRAVAYLKGRGLTGQVAKDFALGYAPEGWRFLSTVFPDYTADSLVQCGLVIASEADAAKATEERRYDRFRDRVMFPIRNVKGEVIGFGGRVLDKGEPKYLNSPETPLFSKGRELYGLFEGRTAMRERGYALVTEGYMDVVALAQMGFGNAVATLGTACTAEHVHKLFRFSDRIVFSFDGDSAGRRAARKALEAAIPYASDTREIKFLFLPSEHDPDSFIRANGADAFEQAVAQATPLSQFLVDAAGADLDLSTAEGRAHFLSQAKALWLALPEGALKRQLLATLADMANLGSNEVLDLWQARDVRTTSRANGKQGAQTPRPDGPSSRQRAQPKDRANATPSSGGQARYQAFGGTGVGYGRAHSAGRGGINSRADHVARIVLTHPEAWGWLSTEEQHLLAELPVPHGPIFTWLEAQWHDRGPQPWAALQAGIGGEPFAAHAMKLVAQSDTLGSENEGETQAEFRQLLRRMLIEHLQEQERMAIQQAENDPKALSRYKAIQTRRMALQGAP
ncbi:MAG: DNA primase [Burkholderiaceae bacterium]|nr:DNA primase [Burkholderiaceae bacterium]MDO7553235.1 DNA primase [Burkholderiaceae bacterium]MDO7579966.1 DNA primase [Burkholderiaceae bacterium]MDO7669251.1 DNA primase [Burkholderiaceae bacterium]MDO7670813.1 DNA primase [Burkholderiaceae bacterium]